MNIAASSRPRFKRTLVNILSVSAILAIALANTGSVARAQDPVLPSLKVSVSEDYFRGDNFAPNTELTFETYASADPGAELIWSTAGTTDENGYVFIPRVDATPDLVVGNYVVAANEDEQKELVLEDVTIDSFDTFTDVVTGTAPAGRFVWVWGGNDVGPGCAMGATAEADGKWTADFKTLAEPCELEPWYWGAVELGDGDGDATVYEKGADPALLTVNTTDDDDDGTCDETHCSLREAINFVNMHNAQDTIEFSIPGDGPFIIQPQSALPQIVRPVTIDGTTQPGYDGSPIVELDGSATQDADGLVITGGSSTVRGLVIYHFAGVGVLLSGSYETGTGGNLIEGNYLGTDISGSSAAGNNIGVYAFESSGNTIRGNLLSGNIWAGVGIRGVARDNVISGNRIGTSADGMSAVPNTIGVLLEESASQSTIGGTGEGEGNLISGNLEDGVRIKDLDTNENTVQGNLIGTDATGAAALGNGQRGVAIDGTASKNLIGGSDEGQGNVISGNGAAGIRISYPDTTANVVAGNYIGTDFTGTNALGNGYVGVRITDGATGNLIGGPGAGNVISGNNGDGVLLDGGAAGNFVHANFIGTDKTGTTTASERAPAVGDFTVTAEDVTCPAYAPGTNFDGFVSQSDDPVAPWSGTSVTFKGTEECPDAEMYNASSLIYRYRIEFDEPTELQSIAVTGAAFNGPDNVLRLLDQDRNELAVAGTGGGNSQRTNYLFLQGVSGQTFYLEEYDTSTAWRYRESIVVNGPLPLGNRGSGVWIGGGATGNTIGGVAESARNLISGNLGVGVDLQEQGTTGNHVQGNYIGTDAGGMQALGNLYGGVAIGNEASDNVIGGVAPGEGNLVSGNFGDGIAVFNSGTTDNTLQGNYVGTDASGTAALPNQGAGIWLGEGATNTLIGGTDTGARNLVSANATHGVSINHPQTTGTRVLGNYIGTDVTGTLPLTNAAGGVYVSSPETRIGEPGAGNLISGNDGLAIYFGGADDQGAAYGDFIQGNLIGTNASGDEALPNGGGIYLDRDVHDIMIGGTQAGAGNVIANSLWVGIGTAPDAGLSNSFLTNLVYSNGFGIDLAIDGPTLNDPRDPDTGPNNLQNFPVLERPKMVAGNLRLTGSLFSNANTTYRLEFFAVPACDPTGYGQGQLLLGFGQVTTSPGGRADFSFLLPPNLPAGWLVTSTATDSSGNTSEFSMCSAPLK